MAVKKGFTAGCFDLIHVGHILMLREAKTKCDYLTVFLQTDPTIDRPEKNKPVESFFERYTKLASCRFVDEIIVYQTEEDLLNYIKHYPFDIRIIGSDHEGRKFTGDRECARKGIEVYFNERNHFFSTSGLRERVYQAQAEKYAKETN
jgi:glycerol-3-phosphate cytidylyltransferase